MPNQLANETSPYLLQHKENPVDWHPWGPVALERSKEEGKPIFLSIGYSACHWCHVMEHESFENERIAAIINEHFIPIKVDREERPDLDQIYMNAVQMMTGRGGWPMSVFLTPELEPFYAGTYFPPTRRQGMPGFDEILTAVNDAWVNRREQAEKVADDVTAELQKLNQAGDPQQLSRELIQDAVEQLTRAFDGQWGGFGAAPKFPHSMDLQLLLRHWFRTGHANSLQMVETTLDRMAAGGIYDHLGGGFARYSVDERWLVPHFEKMLYDNGLLALVYLEAYQATGQLRYAQVARETLDYVLRDMTDPAGGFYSAEDADSEGEEGKFYVWTPAELNQVLGSAAAETIARVYDVTESGNFEGKNILNLPKSIGQAARVLNRDEADLSRELAASREKLFAAREKRVHPGKDDKVLVSWNALMIDAMARAGVVLQEPRYADAAVKSANFILTDMRRPDGRLLHTWRGGTAKLDAYLDDYAYLAGALITLYETTSDPKWIDAAVEMVGILQEHFYDEQSGAFFFTADDHEQLIARQKDLTDASVPSGNASAALALLRLGKLTGDAEMIDAAVATMGLGVDMMQRAPTAMGQMLLAVDFHLGPTYELVFTGDVDELLTDVQRQFLPNNVLAATNKNSAAPPDALADLFAGKETDDEKPRLYVCESFTCQAPAEGALAISAAVAQMTRQPSAE